MSANGQNTAVGAARALQDARDVLADHEPGEWAPRSVRMARELLALSDRLAAVAELHVRRPATWSGDRLCQECMRPHPCPTVAAALGQDPAR